ncbi:glycosyltransferase family 4 protein [Butyrivibrio hungatei]|uniref:glycosyltransferase family 4 protein n=1 Tax=Butyrivibrio hungatei TaxID=185008 RepID=UPI0015B71CFC|nr:glycosyltransferase [Butyrivibrio hungatei]
MILPEYAEIYGVRKYVLEGWMSSLLSLLLKNGNYSIACCFPIRDESRMKNGIFGELQCYSFHASMNDEGITSKYISEFEDIYQRFNPDAIHIWGTEYRHSLVAAIAAERSGYGNKVLIHIQGLVSAIVPYFNFGVDDKWLDYRCNGYKSMRENQLMFVEKGKDEIETISKATYILGRTNWDHSYVKYICKSANYLECGEVLRKEFYNTDSFWSVKNCNRYSIFISQADYALKGLHLILPAIAMLREDYPDIHVTIAGGNGIANGIKDKEKPHDRFLLNILSEYGLLDIVDFIKALTSEEMVEQYLKAHVFVNCSTIENSSNSIGEAQMLGVPVIASYTGGTPDLIEHERTGVMYQMDAPYMFVECFRKIVDNDTFSQEMSECERKVANDRYSREGIYSQISEIYKKVSNES